MSEIPPNVQPPTPDEIRAKAAKHNIDLSDEEVADFAEAIAGTLEGYERLDVLAMPTTPKTAHERRDDLSRLEVIDRTLNMLPNTAPFDVSGHPALSVPCGTADGLPVGLMLVGERFDDATVLQAGDAFERNHDWESF